MPLELCVDYPVAYRWQMVFILFTGLKLCAL